MYIILREIYKSQYSKVYEAKKTNSSLKFILKQSQIADIYMWEEKIAAEILSLCKKTVIVGVDEIITGSAVMNLDGKYLQEENKYLVMHFKNNTGRFLANVIEKEELTVEMALRITEEIIKSEIILKQAGYLHGDIHPNNIFMDGINLGIKTPGNALFIDLATACKVGEAPKHKYASKTFEYSAPEILMGSNIRTEKSEIYSIARVFGKMLEKAGEAYGVELACENILMCGLDNNPEYRYGNLEEMLQDVKEALAAIEKIDTENPDYLSFFEYLYKNFIPVKKLNKYNYPFNCRQFRAAVDTFSDRQKQDEKKIVLNQYLWEALDIVFDENRENIDAKVWFNLYYTGLAVYNNAGRTAQAFEIIEKYHSIEKEGKSLWDEYNFSLREAVAYAEAFKYEEALQVLKKKTSFLFGLEETYIETAKALSSFANILAKYSYEYPEKWTDKKLNSYIRKNLSIVELSGGNPIVDCYDKALSIFDENTSDYKITYSYLIHYFLTKENKAEFELYFSRMFPGVTDLRQLFVEDKFPFNRLIYLKAIYYFYPELITREFCVTIGNELIKYQQIEHPLQQICQYGGFIIQKCIGIEKEDEELLLFRNQLFKSALSLRNVNKTGIMDVLFCMTAQNYRLQLIAVGKSDETIVDTLSKMCKEYKWVELNKKLRKDGCGRLYRFDY